MMHVTEEQVDRVLEDLFAGKPVPKATVLALALLWDVQEPDTDALRFGDEGEAEPCAA